MANKLMFDGSPVCGSGGSSGEVYSTEETRIGTWIDGKPIYKKTILGTIDLLDRQITSATFPVGATVDTLISLNGTLMSIWGARYVLPFVEPKTSPPSCMNVVVGNDSEAIAFIAYWTGRSTGNKLVCEIKYTKTTDEAANRVNVAYNAPAVKANYTMTAPGTMLSDSLAEAQESEE